MEKKIYEEELPHRGKHIDWEKIKNDNIRIKFIYNEIEGYINILKIEVIDKRSYVTIQYKEVTYTLDVQNLKKCKLGKILKVNNSEFKIKNELNIRLAKERVGEINYNAYGEKMILKEYKSRDDIVVEFNNGHMVNTRYDNFKSGIVKNPLAPTVFGVGYIGIGKYNSKDENHNKSIQYNTWYHMLARCYNKKTQEKQPTYKGCIVDEEWHNFQNFAKWFDENYYEVENERMEIDKDILHKGNKIYSKNMCVFVPQRINLLFIKRDKLRGDLPIGVSYNKINRSYISGVRGLVDGKAKNIFNYSCNSSDEAFYAYKTFKEQYIKEIADEYKNKIPQNLYKAMYNYKVEITD